MLDPGILYGGSEQNGKWIELAQDHVQFGISPFNSATRDVS
jgi:hypothetical protein